VLRKSLQDRQDCTEEMQHPENDCSQRRTRSTSSMKVWKQFVEYHTE
jgi:hypothetical protein